MNTVEHLLRRVADVGDDPVELGRLGREFHDRNRLDHARELLERATSLDPSDGRNWVHLAYCYLRSWDPPGGLAVLRRGLEATDRDPLLLVALSHFTDDEEEKARLKGELTGRQEAHARAGLLAHETGGENPEPALVAMERVAASEPENAPAWEQVAWSLLGLRRRGAIEGLDLRARGLPICDRLQALAPDAILPRWLRVQMLVGESDWNAVLDATRDALDHFPDDETLMQLRAQAHARLEDAEAATHWYARAIGAKPSFAGARVELGKLYESRGRLDLAEALFRELPRANPSWPLSPISLAFFLARRGRLEEAEPIFLEGWRRLPEPLRASVKEHPDLPVLLERDAVRVALG